MPLKVIYVDDEPELLEIFFEQFGSDQVQIQTFSNPKAAIEEIKKGAPDVLFLDYQLQGTTGDVIAQTVDAEIPKFLITGNLGVKTQAQFVQILQKPVGFDQIQKILDERVHAKSDVTP